MTIENNGQKADVRSTLSANILIIVLACLTSLAVTAPVFAQDEQLKIRIVKGEGDSHRPGDKTGSQLVVQVLNDVDLPQPDAEVIFAVAKEGASVYLDSSNSSSRKLKSDSEGQVRLDNVRGNRTKGKVLILVKSTFENKTGSAEIHQINERPAFWTTKKKILVTSALAVTGMVLYEILKPGPPTATINTPTAGTAGPQVILHPRIGK